MRLCFSAMLVALLSCVTSHADVLELNDGSRIAGTLKGMTGDKVSIETKYAGTLSLPLDSIVGISSENEIFVHLASGSVLKGKGEAPVATPVIPENRLFQPFRNSPEFTVQRPLQRRRPSSLT